jgi:hypothetical protein
MSAFAHEGDVQTGGIIDPASAAFDQKQSSMEKKKARTGRATDTVRPRLTLQ